mgnify:CR=1 FL=1
MKNFAVTCAVALALVVPGVAQAANPDGNHVFTGSVQVKKNLSSWTTCTLTLTVNVAGGVAKVSGASLAGAYPCTSITFSGLPASVTTSGTPVNQVTVNAIKTNIPPVLIFPSDACLGNLTASWAGNTGATRTIVLSDPLSDTPDTNPDNPGATENNCKIVGAVVQTAAPLLNL